MKIIVKKERMEKIHFEYCKFGILKLVEFKITKQELNFACFVVKSIFSYVFLITYI